MVGAGVVAAGGIYPVVARTVFNLIGRACGCIGDVFDAPYVIGKVVGRGVLRGLPVPVGGVASVVCRLPVPVSAVNAFVGGLLCPVILSNGSGSSLTGCCVLP